MYVGLYKAYKYAPGTNLVLLTILQSTQTVTQ